MVIQQLCDELTINCHNGQAQAVVMHVSGEELKNVTGIEMIGDNIALIKSENINPELKDKLLDLKANFDYFIEGQNLKIKELGERCNQLLKDKGDLTDKCKSLEEGNNKLLDVINNQDVKVADLEKKYFNNITDCDWCDTYCNSQLIKAKEIIKNSIVLLTKPRTALDTKTYLMKAEQFLKGENIILEDAQAGNSPFNADEVFNKEMKAYPKEK